MKFILAKLLLVLASTSLGLAQEDGLAEEEGSTPGVDNSVKKCYVCTGNANSKCGNKNVKNHADQLVECEPGQFCRVVTIRSRRVIHEYGRPPQGEVMFSRHCWSKLYKNSTEDKCYNKTVHQTVCQCFENECNGVSGVKASVVLLAGVILARVIL